jgi:uncharacterized membrane protein YhiD involved in acid resistance
MNPADQSPPVSLDQTLLLDGWRDFAHGWLLLDMVVVLLIALALGAIIAFHPATRRRVSTLYAMVAAMVALIVKVQPAMAFVIFGIGGLLRFRTDTGQAKDTGRIILVTVVGLCCGLGLFVVAVPATVIGWLVVFSLHRQSAGIVRVSGVSEDAIYDAVRSYRSVIQRTGCSIIGEQTKFIRREFMFVVQAPPMLTRAALQHQLDQLPAPVRGVVELEQL